MAAYLPDSPPIFHVPSPSLSLVEVGSSDPDVDFDFDAFRQRIPYKSEFMPPVLRSASRPSSQEGKPPECFQSVLSCFPDLCHDYFLKVAPEHEWNSESLIIHLLDEQEKGRPYPKRSNHMKRKRPNEEEKDEQEEMRKKFETAGSSLIGKDRDYFKVYTSTAKTLLKATYPQLYAQDVDSLLKENDYRIYASFLALDKVCAGDDANRKYRFKKTAPKRATSISSHPTGTTDAEKDAFEEFQAASATCRARAAKKAEEQRKEKEEADNFECARADGTLIDCGCCFDELPRNRMVHCDGGVPHWFCRGCARRMAESEIGLSKYHLECMSMDGCDATFAKDQKELFLDAKLAVALDTIEQEAVLRMAGIENLETCPFCSYAEEYPPVEENKEFRCLNPECALVSCRHCRQETHIPKTCDEAAREIGHSARRKIEEAMSAAMIRKCNKCATPFIKENGCNKMTCTRSGCRNVQCYVCSKSCDYSHFDDSTRGGKKGNCPLFDSVDRRHEEEVQAAEDDARKQVAKENPKVDDELLKFNFSENVKNDEERRKAANPHFHPPVAMNFAGVRVFPAPVHAQVPNFAWAPPNPAQQAQDVLHGPLPEFQARLFEEGPAQAARQVQAFHQARVQPALDLPAQPIHQRLPPPRPAHQAAQQAAQHIQAERLRKVQQVHGGNRLHRAEAQAVQQIREAQRPQLVRPQVAEQAQQAQAQASVLGAPAEKLGERLAKARDQKAAWITQTRMEHVREAQARKTMDWLDERIPQAARQLVGPFAWPDSPTAVDGRAPAVPNAGVQPAAKREADIQAAVKKNADVEAVVSRAAMSAAQAYEVLENAWAYLPKRHPRALADQLNQVPLPVLSRGPANVQRPGRERREVIDLTGDGDGDNEQRNAPPLLAFRPAAFPPLQAPKDLFAPQMHLPPGYEFPHPELGLGFKNVRRPQ